MNTENQRTLTRDEILLITALTGHENDNKDKVAQGLPIIKPLDTHKFEIGNTRGRIVALGTENENIPTSIHAIFAPTNDEKDREDDLLLQLLYLLKENVKPLIPSKIPRVLPVLQKNMTGVGFHQGVLINHKNIREEFRKGMQEFRDAYRNIPVHIQGYSLGGMIGLFAGIDLAYDRLYGLAPKDITITQISSPNSLNGAARKRVLEDTALTIRRLNAKGDFMTKLPFTRGYVPIGDETIYGDGGLWSILQTRDLFVNHKYAYHVEAALAYKDRE